jgi:hypothetical protein
MRVVSLRLPRAAPGQGTSFGGQIVITKTAILEALDELINYGEGFPFQALGVILAKKKCPELKASEPKSDLGLDAYAPGELFENGLGRGVACSNTPTLSKIREDIEQAQKHFSDLKVLFFATPRPVGEKKANVWRQEVKKDYGITLIVISREEVINELLKPENASLCSSILRIPTTIEASLEQIASDSRAAMTEINASWVPRVPGAPLIDLSADQLESRGNQTDSILELKDLQEMLMQSRRVTLEAPAGRGKTTTLTQIAERCAAAGNLALIVDLPSWTQTGEDILEFISGMRPFKARSIDATKLAKIYESQHFIFLLNGWNEIAEADSQRAQTALGTLERQYPKAGILVSTRTHRLKPPLPGTTVRAKLRFLSPKQRADYVVARLGERAAQVLRRIRTEPVLDNLTLTPLFLSEVVSIAGAGKEIPNTKMGVLREVVHLPDADPTHHGALEIAPLSGQADAYLTTLASAMTTNSQTQVAEAEAKQITNEKLRQMREWGEVDGTSTVHQVLGALVGHHFLERIEYPAVAYRFEHQQIQEYYAAEFVKKELFGLVAGANRSDSQDAVVITAEAKSFQVKYVNQSSWSEPLCMVAGDLDGDSSSNEPNKQLIQAKAALVLLALDVDLIFASELFGLCGPEVQELVAEKLYAAIRRLWASLEKAVRSQALAAMIATGSDFFKEEILSVLKGAGDYSRFEVYRSTSAFHLSSLGSEWQKEVSSWGEGARLSFVSEMFHMAGPLREMAEFALSDPSLEVRAHASSDLMWMNADEETTKLIMEVDEPAFEAAIERVPVHYTHPIFRARSLQVYLRILAESSDPAKRLMAAVNAVLMEQLDAHPALRECLDECSADQVRQMAQRELRPLLEALTSDRVWRSDWIVRRVLEGALNAEQWGALIDPIDASLKDQLLQRLETEDLSKARAPGVQGLLRLNADAEIAGRIFARILELHQAIEEAVSIRSESNLTRARELGELRSQLEGFLRKLPAQTMVDGILAALSPEFSFIELKVLSKLWDRGMDNDADLHEVLTEPSREAARKYLTDAVSRLTNENDPSGEVRAHLAVAISRVADPEDISYVVALLESEIGRIRAARTARATGEKSQLADGSPRRYTNRYMLAVRQLQSDSEGPFLAMLLAESDYERDVAWALVEWALERSLLATVSIDGWSNRPREFREIWEARASSEVTRFDETRRKAAVGYLRSHIDSLTSGLSAETPDPQIVWRLKDLMRPLATLDSKASTALILEVLALPLQTHGRMDGWKRIQPLETMLFEGATLPNDQTLAITMPVIDELNSQWHPDNERSLFSMAFSIMPFLGDPRAGIAVLAELLERTGLSFEGLSKVVSALGHSRCDGAVDLLVSIASKEGIANSLGNVWINALATLDTPRAREILMSFIDPESPEVTGTLKTGCEDMLSRRIAELAGKYPTIRSRILNLCQASLDRAKRTLLASVIVQLGDSESLLEALYLLDDELNPQLPYDLGKAVEEAFVEHRPTGENSNSYTLHPRAANELRDRLIEMTRSDPKRKVSALALLSRIESWRVEYGRPIGETRNPIFAI